MTQEPKPTASLIELFDRGMELGATSPLELTVDHRKGALTGIPYVVIPKTMQVADLRHLLLPPREFSHCFDEVDSFIDFINYYQQNNTRLYCVEQDGKFRAIIDEHKPSCQDSGNSRPWCDERLMVGDLILAKTPEWAAWSSAMGKALQQMEFALFLEDNGRFVTRPSAAEFLQVALTLEAKKGVNFKSGLRLENGDHKLIFEEDTRTTAGVKGELEIPHDFEISLRLYHGGSPSTLAGKLRYKLSSGTIVFYYKFPGLENIVRSHVSGIRDRIAKETGLAVWSMSALT